MLPLPQLGCDYHVKRRRQFPWSPYFHRAGHFDIKISTFVTCDRFCVLPVPKTNCFHLRITIVTWLAQLSVLAQIFYTCSLLIRFAKIVLWLWNLKRTWGFKVQKAVMDVMRYSPVVRGSGPVLGGLGSWTTHRSNAPRSHETNSASLRRKWYTTNHIQIGTLSVISRSTNTFGCSMPARINSTASYVSNNALYGFRTLRVGVACWYKMIGLVTPAYYHEESVLSTFAIR